MAIRFIRKPSDTPNISNADDTRILRYAFGDYNGYIKGKGAELSYSINGSIFKINSGVIILQGYDVEIDANGWELAVDNVATKRYFSVYLEVNLATQTADIKSMYNTAGYPTIATGDDLTASNTGTARLLLYTFTGQSGVIAEVSKKVVAIEYNKDLLAAEKLARETEDAKKLNKSGHTANRVLVIDTKGEIGYSGAGNIDLVLGNGGAQTKTTVVSQGSPSLVTSGGVYAAIQAVKNITSATISSSASLSVATVKRQVNFVIGQIIKNGAPVYGAATSTVPSGYRPSSTYTAQVGVQVSTGSGIVDDIATMSISTTGAITFSGYSNTLAFFDIIFAYEIT